MSDLMSEIQRTCQCGHNVRLNRGAVTYWPDNLWPGKIQAHYKCEACGKESWMWAHDLPPEWHCDWTKYGWDEYCLARLHESLHLHNIEAIPGIYPTSKWWKQWHKENGFDDQRRPLLSAFPDWMRAK